VQRMGPVGGRFVAADGPVTRWAADVTEPLDLKP